MAIMIKNIDTEPYVQKQVGTDGRYAVPGAGRLRQDLSKAKTKFLGDPEKGPWLYLLDRPAGDGVPLHMHSANRIEFVVEGEIHWKDSEGRDEIYGAGTVTYVTARTKYEYTVTKPTRILLWFDEKPSFLEEGSR